MSNNPPERYGMLVGLQPDKLNYYKQLHTAVWPSVLKKITECNIQNYSIYIKQISNSYFLFSYFEYSGNNFDDDMKKMAADSETQRWWKETVPCVIPFAEAFEKGTVWTRMEEVFHHR
jgi:L-rhamnose mutarotase